MHGWKVSKLIYIYIFFLALFIWTVHFGRSFAIIWQHVIYTVACHGTANSYCANFCGKKNMISCRLIKLFRTDVCVCCNVTFFYIFILINVTLLHFTWHSITSSIILGTHTYTNSRLFWSCARNVCSLQEYGIIQYECIVQIAW